jgi:hypothetical protein
MKNFYFFNIFILCGMMLCSCSNDDKFEKAKSDLLPLFTAEINKEIKIDSIFKPTLDSIEDQETTFYDYFNGNSSDADKNELLEIKSMVSDNIFDSLYLECIKIEKLYKKTIRVFKEQKEFERKNLLIQVKIYLDKNKIDDYKELEKLIEYFQEEHFFYRKRSNFPLDMVGKRLVVNYYFH